MIARELRFASWARLKAHIESMDRERAAIKERHPAPDGHLKTLHLRCGLDIKETLAAGGFVGDFLEHAIPYCLGRVVIWMEPDSWDQLILARLLAHYANAKRPRVLELIAVPEFPGAARYIGLGQLPPEALRLLWPTRKPVTQGQLALGNDVWTALASSDPRRLAAIARSGTPALPIMAAALHRHLRELPAVENGLGLTEHLILQIVSEGTPARPMRVWADVYPLPQKRDPLPWLPDLAFRNLINGMLSVSDPVFTFARYPALPGRVGVESPGKFQQLLAITDFGRAVLRGERDWLASWPPARWVGGVHVLPGVPGWRWDEARREAVPPQA